MPNQSSLGGLLVALVGVAIWFAGHPFLAVCALSFWHYLLYALAFRYGAVPLAVFKRDAMLMKSVALFALASAYLAMPLDFASLAVVAAGFALNMLAASALGSDRTYYGFELAKLPPLRVTGFPYSITSHPMLLGNMLAYGGTLLNAGFREQWWPLACAHLALNLGLLIMERHLRPLRLGVDAAVASRAAWSWLHVFGLAIAGAGLAIGAASFTESLSMPLAGALGAAIAIYGHILLRTYTAPRSWPLANSEKAL